MKNTSKQELRKRIIELKKQQSVESMTLHSVKALTTLEDLPIFKGAKTILLYHALKDEVQTAAFINKWREKKTILLPVVEGDFLKLKIYNDKDSLSIGAYGIEEPSGKDFTDYNSIDLAIIPGMSFDKKGNRLGRGKGYYDRLLPNIDAYKIGLCYQFQISEYIPTETHDKLMDAILTENGIITEI